MSRSRPLFNVLASTLSAAQNCAKLNNKEWNERHLERLSRLVRIHMPYGSGFDNGTRLSESSTPEKLIFETSFHHMDSHGFYDGWTQHTITVTASLVTRFNLKISGRDRNQIKEYISDSFHSILMTPVSDMDLLEVDCLNGYAEAAIQMERLKAEAEAEANELRKVL